MSRLVFVVSLSCLLISCAHSQPYFVELDPLSMKRTVPKYGGGKHYFFTSYHVFTSSGDATELKKYFQDVKFHISKKFSIRDNCEAIEETLSYYSEGGSVSVLVVCRGT